MIPEWGKKMNNWRGLPITIGSRLFVIEEWNINISFVLSHRGGIMLVEAFGRAHPLRAVNRCADIIIIECSHAMVSVD